MRIVELPLTPGLTPPDGSRTYGAYSPGAYPVDEESYARPGSPDLPPASETLKTVRLRFAPGADVLATLTAGYGWLEALADPDAEFLDGFLLRSPGTITFNNLALPGATVACPHGADCSFGRVGLAQRRILADGTVELFWSLQGDSFGEAAAVQQGLARTGLPAAQRPLPRFAFWDEFFIDVGRTVDPFVGPADVPAPFSILFEFTSGLSSQGFFDRDGVASTVAPQTVFTFIGEPTYGFVSDLRPDPDPRIEVSLAGGGIAFAVPAPGSAALLLAACAVARRARRR